MDKIAVLIPCYNESRTIKKVVEDFKRVLPEAVIYVYDNNSTDGTDEIARQAGAVVRYEYKQGKGNGKIKYRSCNLIFLLAVQIILLPFHGIGGKHSFQHFLSFLLVHISNGLFGSFLFICCRLAGLPECASTVS